MERLMAYREPSRRCCTRVTLEKQPWPSTPTSLKIRLHVKSLGHQIGRLLVRPCADMSDQLNSAQQQMVAIGDTGGVS